MLFRSRNDAVLADVEGGDTGDTAADDTATDDTAADDTGSDGPTDSGDKPGDPPSSRFRCACGGGEPATGLELLLAAWVVARRRARNPPTSSGSA